MPEIKYVDAVKAAQFAYGKFEDEGKAAKKRRIEVQEKYESIW